MTSPVTCGAAWGRLTVGDLGFRDEVVRTGAD